MSERSNPELTPNLPEQENMLPASDEKLPETDLDSGEAREKQNIMETARRDRYDILVGYMSGVANFVEEHAPESVLAKAREVVASAKSGRDHMPKWVKEVAAAIWDITSGAANVLGFWGSAKMLLEALLGRTFDGQRLTNLGAINHVVIHGLFFGAWSAAIEFHAPKTALALYLASWTFHLTQYGPKHLTTLAQLAGKIGRPEMHDKLEKLREALNQSRSRKLFFKETYGSG